MPHGEDTSPEPRDLNVPLLEVASETKVKQPSIDGKEWHYSFKPEELIGRTYMTEPNDDGEIFCATIVQHIKNHNVECSKENLKFLVKMGPDKAEEVIAYNELIDLVEHECSKDDPDKLWHFKWIAAHQGPLHDKDPCYNGSSFNVLVEWEDGSETYEPLDIVAKDDPAICAKYAKENKLLNIPGWKRFKRLAKREKTLQRMMNAAKRKSVRTGPIYKFGVQVPRNVKQAMQLDEQNGNTLWMDAMKLEISQLQNFQTFKSLGFGARTPAGFQKTILHWVFDVKSTLRRHARLVAGGHLTVAPLDVVYSGVVSMQSFRMVAFLAELNGLEFEAADISNAYLEALSKEKIVVTAGPEFGELAGHTLQIVKALYGCRGSGQSYHDHFADTMRDMGFAPSRSDPEVWMRDAGDSWEYVTVYTDDLAVALKDPKAFFKELEGPKYQYHLKGVGPVEHHLGADFSRDADGILCQGAKSYIQCMMDNYKVMFDGEDPHGKNTPLDPNDHPELDETGDLSPEDVSKYQSMVGCLLWCVTLGRVDIAQAVMTMARFRAAPKIGHLDCLKHMYGYLKKHDSYTIRYDTTEPDFSEHDAKWVDFDWMHAVYGGIKEEIPDDAPEPKGKRVMLSTFVDANLMHDLITGRAATGILHFANGTLIDQFSKRQATVETATYGSELVAARLGSEQVMDIRLSFMYLGVPVHGPTYMFGDNNSVIQSTTIPHSKLNKRHNILAFHRVRECISSGVLRFIFTRSENNLADCLTKNLVRAKLEALLKIIFRHK